jgi:adhesin transport system membrane fusion protein
MVQFSLLGADEEPRRTAPVATRALLWSIASFTTALIGWAAVAKVNETVTAHGRVVPQRPLQVISNLEGGIVAAILVRPGQHVAAGAALLRLDPARAQADFGRSTVAVQALAARILRLEAEVAGTRPVFPKQLEAAAPEAVAAERSLWSARYQDRASTMAGMAARRDGAARALAEAGSSLAAATEARAQAAREAALMAPLVDKGIEPRLTLDRARSTLVQADAACAGAAERVRLDAGNDLALARAELAGQSAVLPALQHSLERTAVRSPIAGTIQRVLVATIGGSVAAGAPLVEVVPSAGALVVDARVRPRDIGFVRIGQRAAVKLTAYESSVYGTLQGMVTRISPDAITDERGGDSSYQIRIETPQRALMAPNGTRLPIGPGMVADVDLLGPRRTVLSYLLSPVTKLTSTAFRER